MDLHSTLVILQLSHLLNWSLWKANLHSTLVILQLLLADIIIFIWWIYIPLWLYYNGKEYYRFNGVIVSTFHSGYITMQNGMGFNSLFIKSTFHSGYITINLCVKKGLTTFSSTFHSGYITIEVPFGGYTFRLNLHSTLVILQ